MSRASVCLLVVLCSSFLVKGQGRRLLIDGNSVQLTTNTTSFQDGDIVQVNVMSALALRFHML